MHAGLLVLMLAGLAGCDGTGSRPPTAPSTVQAPQAAPRTDTYHVADVILSGVVYEETPTGKAPIEGVKVSLDYFHVLPTPDVVTDSQGFFRFTPVWVCPCSWAPWVDAGFTSIQLEKDGYMLAAGQPPSIFAHPLYRDRPQDGRTRDVMINGDTHLDIQLVRR